MEWRASAEAVRWSSLQNWYVYVLKLSNNSLYTGCTSNLEERLTRHQKGYVNSTCSFLPVQLVFFCVFFDKNKAFIFEKYLKSGSGRAFCHRHLV
jgi:predicted GIY-YIG superfamily endonuclease